MDIRLHNTLSRSTETFTPLTPGTVTMYSCGPTVYDTPHIGNYRSFVLNDLLLRVFEYNDYQVNHVMNITDVDDKTIRKSSEEHLPLTELTRKYEKLFLDGLESLNILTPHSVVRATEHIGSMIALITTLLEKGVAYKADDGVYMSVAKVKDYGALAHIDPSAISKERITNDEYDKDSPRDFALWKFHTPADGDVSWDAPFGAGRPGWHIECSAMAMEALGATIDIHTGGSDLVFPHHTNEIAQSESATGKQFVRYWVHGGFMTIHDEKMAKSKGNTTKLEDLQREMISPLTYRYWLLTAHYRSPVNFSFEAIRGAQNALLRLLHTAGNYPQGGAINTSYRERFLAYINDDIDTAQAVALMWELIKDASVSDADKRATLLDFDRVFGFSLATIPTVEDDTSPIPPEIQALADARQEARANKDWVKADALRSEIEARGYTLLDTETGFKIVA